MNPYDMPKRKIIAVPVIRHGTAYVYDDTIEDAIEDVKRGNWESVKWTREMVDYTEGIAVYEEV